MGDKTLIIKYLLIIAVALILGIGIGKYGFNDCPDTKVIAARCEECPEISIYDCINITRNAQEYLNQIKQEVDNEVSN